MIWKKWGSRNCIGEATQQIVGGLGGGLCGIGNGSWLADTRSVLRLNTSNGQPTQTSKKDTNHNSKYMKINRIWPTVAGLTTAPWAG
mgnify:CR=1 FL=1